MDNKDLKLICGLIPECQSETPKIKKAGGQTNRNYVVRCGKKAFFVRLPWERSDILDRKVEGKNILALSRNKKLRNILPKYFVFIVNGRNILRPGESKVFNAPDGALVSEYIPGEPFSLSLLRKNVYQEKLAEMFHVFHTSSVRFANKYNVFSDEIRKYRKAAQKYPIHNIVDEKTATQMKHFEKRAEAMMDSLKKGISTHNDFIFQNFLVGKDGRIYLLDFEYAGLSQKGGIVYDFGFLFADNLFRKQKITKELFEEFLSAADKIYGRRFDREQIYWSSIAAVLVQFWWGLVRYFSVKNSKEKKYFKDYVLKRVKGIDFIFFCLQEKRD